MSVRVFVAVFATVWLTAFAPAPFPRRDRAQREEGVALAQIQGTWNVTKLEHTGNNGALSNQGDYLKEVRIEGDRWSFYYRRGGNAVHYTIKIDHKITPAPLDFYSANRNINSTPHGTGILHRQGNTLKLLYTWSSNRPASFENRPAGCYLITLQRTR